jgi:ATP-binding cassette subfamily F protein uup
LDKLCSSLLVFQGNGQVVRHHGNWDAWLEREEARQQVAKEREAREASSISHGSSERGEQRHGPRKRTDREERELRLLRERIDTLEGEGAELESRLADPAMYAAQDGLAAQEATRRYAEVTEALEQALERWMELEELGGRSSV